MTHLLARRLALTLLAASVLLVSACGTLFSSEVTISLDKGRYLRGEEIVATLVGVTERLDNDKAFLGIYVPGSGHDERLEYVYLHAGESQVAFSAPARQGNYELRFYQKAPPSQDALRGSLPFVVDGDVDVTLALDKTVYARGEEITATLNGVTERMNKDGATLAIYRAGGVHGSGYFYESRVDTGISLVEFSTPPETGAYEIRFYRKPPANDDTLAISVPFTVEGEVKVTVKLDKKTYAGGEEIGVTLNGVTDRMRKDGAFLAIYEAGTGHNENISDLTPLPAGNRELLFHAPHESGSYEIRFYRKDSPKNNATLATTVPFTVKRIPQQQRR
ncbi:MAG: hypothetical protein LBP58_02350 [Azoarcus sp.]|jgi:hypothetical protein|nr:hypothetical protein [Azoarcus sp.]